MSRLYYSPYRHFRVVILLHRIRNRMNELFVRIKKVRGKAKVIHLFIEIRKLQSQQVWCHNHNVPTTFDRLQELFPSRARSASRRELEQLSSGEASTLR